MLFLETQMLDLRYAALRIADPAARARLEVAIARDDQQVPVLVVPIEKGQYVLIDGYARVAALCRLGRDVVQAVALDVGEAEGLVLRHQLERGRPRSALEEGWLVSALLNHGQSPSGVAISLAKSPAWVSRRLALVRTLPESVQDAIRVGRLSANAAEKYLVPLSRGNADQCAQLVDGLRTVRPTVRELARLYAAWKRGDADVRAQIAASPLLYLKAEDAVKDTTVEEDLCALRDVEAVAGVCGKARKNLREGAVWRLPSHRRPELIGAWKEARLAFEALSRLLRQEGVDAGQ